MSVIRQDAAGRPKSWKIIEITDDMLWRLILNA